jgi:RNA polymerase sigma-70 factor (ECF subfamily)
MWTMVRLAVCEDRPGADAALDQLCKLYEQPILAYIIRDGHSPQEAQDLKQGFFHHLFSKNALADAEATKVKLRAFLLTKLQGFLIDQYRHVAAQKRGARKVVALGDLSEAQQRLAEPVDRITPDIAFQRQWLASVFSTAMTQLRDDYTSRYQGSFFNVLAPFIDPRNQPDISALAAMLKKPEGTIKSDISRLRARWRELIRNHIAATLIDPTPQAIETELKELMGYR